MGEQSSREFASADAAAGAQDAAVQEPGFSPEISFHTRRRIQHLQTISPTRGSGRDRSPHSAVPTPIVPDGVIRTEAVCLLDLIRVPGSFVGCEPRPRTGRTINLSASATTGAPDARAWGSYLARDWPLSAFRVALAGGLKSAHWRKTSALSEPGKLHYNLT